MCDEMMIRNILTSVLAAELRDDLRFRLFSEDYDRVTVPVLLQKVLKETPGLKENFGKQINFGFGNQHFDSDVVGKAIVNIALDNGVETAVDAVMDFLKQDYCPSVDVILLSGIGVDQKFELCEGVFLARLEDVPTDSMQKFLNDFPTLPKSPSTWAKTFHAYHLEPAQLAESALFRISEARPKFFSMDDPKQSKYVTSDIKLLGEIARLLVLVGPSSPSMRRNYRDLTSGALLSGITGRDGHGTLEDTRVSKTHTSTAEEIEHFKLVLSKYVLLTPAQKKKLEIPLHRLNEAIRHKSSTDRAIDLGIALESLLLEGTNTPQLTLTFRLRGAWLLGENTSARQQISSLLRDLYIARSNSVHSGDVDPHRKLGDVDKLLTDGLELCARLIEAVIDRQTVDWNLLVLGGDSKGVDEEP